MIQDLSADDPQIHVSPGEADLAGSENVISETTTTPPLWWSKPQNNCTFTKQVSYILPFHPKIHILFNSVQLNGCTIAGVNLIDK